MNVDRRAEGNQFRIDRKIKNKQQTDGKVWADICKLAKSCNQATSMERLALSKD